jgi:hypothetical protein
MCDAFNIKRSSYYDWLSRSESRRDKQNRYLLNRIQTIHKASRENNGAVKTWEALRASGENCGCTVLRDCGQIRHRSEAHEAV